MEGKEVPLRHRQLGAVRHRDDRRELRRDQRLARLVHAARRPGAARQHQLGEVIFGGVGAGMYGMLVFIILSVFIAGLMVGRTPEYLGKKIQAFDVQMAMLDRAGLPADDPGVHGDLVGVAGLRHVEHLQSRARTACPRCSTPSRRPGNNGSAFGGLSANTHWYNIDARRWRCCSAGSS